MPPPDHGWAGLDSAPPGPDLHARALARQFARVFGSGEGEAVLAHLQSLTLGRCLGPDASDAALRHLEGQRHLVLHIQSLAERGRAGE